LNKVLLVVLATVSFSVLLGSQEAFAAAKMWDGGAVTLNWSDGDNWDPNGAPSTNDIITIPSPFDVTLDIPFTVGNSGTLTIDDGASLLVDKNKELGNFNVITNAGDLVIDGKVVTSDTLTNQATGTIDIFGDGSADNGVFINEKDGTVTDVGAVKSFFAKWTNAGTYNKNDGLFDLDANSEFTNKEGVLNIDGGTATFLSQGSSTIIDNTQESKINIANNGVLSLQGDAGIPALRNRLLSQINVNDGGIFNIFLAASGVVDNQAKLNVNPGGLLTIGFANVLFNTGTGVIINQGASGNPATINVKGILSSSSEVINNSDGLIDIFPQGILQNDSPGSLKNNKGAEINIQKSGQQLGRITGTGGAVNEADNSIINFGIIDISGPWQNNGKIENNGIINILCGGSLNPLGTITGTGEFNEFECPVGGTLIPIGKTSLLLAYGELNSWWMAPIVIGIGVGVYLVKRRF